MAESPSLTDAITALDAAMAVTNDDPAAGLPQLVEALTRVQTFDVDQLDQTSIREHVIVAELTLARAYLAINVPSEAARTMDRVLQRYATDHPIPASSFGPSLDALYRERHVLWVQQQASRSSVSADTVDVVDVDRSASTPPSSAPARAATAMSKPTSTPSTAAMQPTTAHRVATDRTSSTHRSHPRVLPRWLEITGMVVGAGLMAAGATFVRLHHTCPGDLRRDPATCPILYRTRTGGIVALSIGGALMSSSIVLLGIDAARQGPELSVRWQAGWRWTF